jgi:hypothetical protein
LLGILGVSLCCMLKLVLFLIVFSGFKRKWRGHVSLSTSIVYYINLYRSAFIIAPHVFAATCLCWIPWCFMICLMIWNKDWVQDTLKKYVVRLFGWVDSVDELTYFIDRITFQGWKLLWQFCVKLWTEFIFLLIPKSIPTIDLENLTLYPHSWSNHVKTLKL